MIQRIQSAYLLVAIVLLAALLTLGYPFSSTAAQSLPWFTPALLLLTGLAILVAGATVFQFRNRAAQARTALVGFIAADLLGILQVVGYALAGDFAAMVASGAVLGFIAVALPIVASVLLLLARTAINRDIALVRSMDRLR